MEPSPAPAFDLPDRLAAKAAPPLVAADEAHFAAIAAALADDLAEQSRRLEALLATRARIGQEARDRDDDVRRRSARLRLLARADADVCLGRMTPADGTGHLYVGRLGLSDRDGRRLLLDWRSPAAAPFFAATRSEPLGLLARRRYRWSAGRVVDYWDELLVDDVEVDGLALDDESAFLAGLGAARSARMRDVLATIASDQDSAIRAGSDGATVVEGGPGTGKTVVALHRTAYLLHTDPRVTPGRGGVLVVGPSRAYLSYVADILPGLGEDEVRMCTVRDLVPEGATAEAERDPRVASLKASARMAEVVEAAIRFYEEPPEEPLAVSTSVFDIDVTPDDWSQAFASPEPGVPHNEARDQVWEALVERLAARLDDDVPFDLLRRELAQDEGLKAELGRAWPLLEATDVVGDLWSVPAFLRRCAPWLERDEVQALQRDDAQAWTVSDLPLLDLARRRLGDASSSARRRQERASEQSERARMDLVIEDLLAADDDERMLAQLRQDGIRDALVDQGAAGPAPDPDGFAGPFAHVVVDEAQELTEAEWAMVLSRCPSQSLTVVGDRAQARRGFVETWEDRLRRVGVRAARRTTLTVNYRTPSEVMAEAEPVIRAAVPDAQVPVSVRSSRLPVRHGARSELAAILEGWLTAHAQGIACVIGEPEHHSSARVVSLTAEQAKGLEFDLVVLVEPARVDGGIEAVVDTYVAMTRATEQLVVLRG